LVPAFAIVRVRPHDADYGAVRRRSGAATAFSIQMSIPCHSVVPDIIAALSDYIGLFCGAAPPRLCGFV
jgi:hypothetical protein